MGTCSIDAEYKGEERYSKLSIAYANDEEKKTVDEAVNSVVPKHDLKPEMHTSDIANGRKVLVLEYHDDYDREAGVIFEEILKILDIKCS
jgi:hypothetical protein